MHTVEGDTETAESWYLYTVHYDPQTVILSMCAQLRMMQFQYQHTVNHDAQNVVVVVVVVV